jgi:hypothetical protein
MFVNCHSPEYKPHGQGINKERASKSKGGCYARSNTGNYSIPGRTKFFLDSTKVNNFVFQPTHLSMGCIFLKPRKMVFFNNPFSRGEAQ